MSAHTPGPWRAESFAGRINVWAKKQNGTAVAYDCDEADGLLIAAAPELLEALRASIKYLAFAYSEGFAEAEKLGMEAEDAIAKATGSAQ